jgi:hypothetical protein
MAPETKRELLGFGLRFFGGIVAGIGAGLTFMFLMSVVDGIDPLDWWADFWAHSAIGGGVGFVIGIFWAIAGSARTPVASAKPPTISDTP